MSIPMPSEVPAGAATPAPAVSAPGVGAGDVGAGIAAPPAVPGAPCSGRVIRSWTDWLAFQLNGRRARERSRRAG